MNIADTPNTWFAEKRADMKKQAEYRNITIELPRELLELLLDESSQMGITPSEYIRRGLLPKFAHNCSCPVCDLPKSSVK